MSKVFLAGVLSIGLHGFLLTQWPLPFVHDSEWGRAGAVQVSLIAAPTHVIPKSRPAPKPSAPPIVAVTTVAPVPSVVKAPLPWPDAARPEKPRGEPSPPVVKMPQPLLEPSSAGLRSASGHGVPSEITQPKMVPPVAPAPSAAVDAAQSRYKQLVRERLGRALIFPSTAGQHQGVVRLRITIARTGAVQQAACERLGEASAVFEEATMDGVSAVGRFPPLPSDLPSESVTCEFRVAFTPGVAATVSP